MKILPFKKLTFVNPILALKRNVSSTAVPVPDQYIILSVSPITAGHWFIETIRMRKEKPAIRNISSLLVKRVSQLNVKTYSRLGGREGF